MNTAPIKRYDFKSSWANQVSCKMFSSSTVEDSEAQQNMWLVEQENTKIIKTLMVEFKGSLLVAYYYTKHNEKKTY